MSGSSLSDSSYSVSSDAAVAGAAPQTRTPKLWEQIRLSADSPDLLWSEGAVQQQQQQQPAQPSREQEGAETTAETPASGELLPSNSLCP